MLMSGVNFKVRDYILHFHLKVVQKKCLTNGIYVYIMKKQFKNVRDLSSAGRASALQAEGHRFEPCRSHQSLSGTS